MSVVESRAFAAIALELLATLERYEADCARLATEGVGSEVYERANAAMDDIQRWSLALPALLLPSAALLIARSEFVQALWNRATGETQPPVRGVEEIAREHRLAIENLRRACWRQLALPETSAR